VKLSLASCAELRQRIAAELQRRHDAWNGGNFVWHFHQVVTKRVGDLIQKEVRQIDFQRFQFVLWLPGPQSRFEIRDSKFPAS
jgi:hypothetical protein